MPEEKPISALDFARRMEAILNFYNQDHVVIRRQAQELMFETLRSLGYGQGVDMLQEWEKNQGGSI